MKCLVIFAGILGTAFSQYWGLPHPVHDTPEVAAAKAEHLAAVEAAKHGAHYVPQVHHHHYAPHHGWEAPQKKWTGPIALPPGYDKHGAPLPVLDTPEVAAEKAKHYHLYAHGAHAGAAAAGRYASSHVPTWHHHGSPAVDTPEVEAAKAAHFAAHHAALHSSHHY